MTTGLYKKVSKRKCTTIFFLIFLFPLLCQEHTYLSMLEEDAYWDVAQVYPAGTCGYYAYNAFRYEIGGDTTINGKVYKYFNRYPLLTKYEELCDFWVGSQKERFTGAFLREDTLERKVYIYVSDLYENSTMYNGKEYLHCDFNLEKGDTLQSEYHNFPIVNSTHNLVTNSGKRKVIGFNQGEYIEQAGWGGLFYKIFNPDSLYYYDNYETICFKVDNDYPLGCIFPMTNDVPDVVTTNPNLFYLNYKTNVISTCNAGTSIQVYIYRLDGKCLKECLLGEGEALNIGYLKRGFYLIKAQLFHEKDACQIEKIYVK